MVGRANRSRKSYGLTMVRLEAVPRPTKKSEYKIYFDSRSAERGWSDLLATRRSALADAWEFLTKTPLETTPLSYRLKGELAIVIRNGTAHECWQLKINAKDGVRIWYYVANDEVQLIRVETKHPNETK
jgi:hypothetical protein